MLGRWGEGCLFFFSFFREEALKSFSQSAGLTTQLFAEGTALLEIVFALTLTPSDLPSQHTFVSSKPS